MSKDRRARLERSIREVVERHSSRLPTERRREIAQELTDLMGEVARERRRCVELCRHRAGLWQRTPSAKHPAPAAAREEARARANEATYLADLIEAERELFPEADA